MTDAEYVTHDAFVSAVREQLDTIRLLQLELSRGREREDVLRRRVDQLESTSAPKQEPTPKPRPNAIDWVRLPDSDRAELMGGLATFVEELVEQQQLHEIVLPCWWKHPASVEELGAMWQARDHAYAPTNDGSYPSWWRDVLERAQPRLRRIFTLCHDGHFENGPRTLPWKSDVDVTEFDEYLAGLKASDQSESSESDESESEAEQRSM